MGLPLFFILGRPRSGTTLLKTLFDAHPNVRIPPELPVFMPLYRRFKGVKHWDEEHIRQFADHVFQSWTMNHRKLENLGIDREAFTGELLKLAGKCTIQDLLIKLNESAVSIFSKQETLLVGDKNPVYSVYVRQLMRIFPDARFICIVRDYRDNYLSLKSLVEARMEAPVLTLQAARWKYITKLFLACQKRYPDRFRIIRYEDLVHRPQEIYRDLCTFLDLPYSDAVFDYHLKKDAFMATNPDPAIQRIHASLMEPVNIRRIGLWKTRLTALEVRTADQIAGKTADRMGYERGTKRISPGIFLRSIPMEIYGRLLFGLMRAGTHMPYRAGRWMAMNLPRLARFYGRLEEKRREKKFKTSISGRNHPPQPG